jgi:hypothetical protein
MHLFHRYNWKINNHVFIRYYKKNLRNREFIVLRAASVTDLMKSKSSGTLNLDMRQAGILRSMSTFLLVRMIV